MCSSDLVEFLRDANTTNSAGQDLYDAWVAQGKAPPVEIEDAGIGVNVTTSVPDGDEAGQKYSYRLSQNLPNPFNPSTTVRYSTASRTHVWIAVYDVAGRRVRVLVDEVRDPGDYSILWDGRDAGGNALASGVYFIRYHAAGRQFWRKAALLK